jgi:hypothetical protein
VLLALLYTDEGYVAAAAPACDQEPYGNRYWMQFHSEPLAVHGFMETAYVEIDDEGLVTRLLHMRFTDGYEAAREVDRFLGLDNNG